MIIQIRRLSVPVGVTPKRLCAPVGGRYLVNSNLLRSVPLFAELDTGDMARVEEHLIERKIPDGGAVFYEGQVASHIYLLHQGKIKVCRYTPGGKEQIIRVWTDTSAFGLIAALGQGYYPANAIALVPSIVSALPVERLRQLAAEIPTLSDTLLRQVGLRMRMFQERLYQQDFLEVQGRLASLLLSMARTTGIKRPEGIRVAVGLTHQDLASMTGTTRETVTRTLSNFRRHALIDLDASGILVRSIDHLERVTVVR